MKSNAYFKEYARKRRVPLWQVGDALGKSENTVNRMLRHELPEEKLDQLVGIVDRLAAGEDPEVIRNGR